jgi:uncharacterized protein (DUF1800 family)
VKEETDPTSTAPDFLRSSKEGRSVVPQKFHLQFIFALFSLGAVAGRCSAAGGSITVSSVTPISANVSGAITITGSGFDATDKVSVAGISFSVQSRTAVQIVASGTLPPVAGGLAAVVVTSGSGSASKAFPAVVTAASPVMTYAAAKRFLEQATWGPTPASIAHLQSIGINAWLSEQFKTPASVYVTSEPAGTGLQPLQTQFFSNAVNGPDQLRQRVAFALSQIAVVSGFKLFTYGQMAGYQQMLLTDAFGKYGDFLRDVTLSPAMGLYLDMVNNDISYVNTPPNQNYARELMQLFSLGTQQLNADGTPASSGAAPYSEADVAAMARVLTGWTYPLCGSGSSAWPNPPCFTGPMVAAPDHHDNTAKIFLGTNVQSGSALGDLNQALSVIESYTAPGQSIPNIAPFVSQRLIQHLVKSNPSPAYVARVAAVYASSGGSLQQVAQAILTDTEARAGDNPSTADPNDGHLREPVFFVTSLLRALNGTVSQTPPLADLGGLMGQELLYSPSVFNFYSPRYSLVQSGGILGPEFQTLNSSTAFVRANYVLLLVLNALSGPDFHVDLSNFALLASDTDPQTQNASLTAMLNAVSNALLGTNMPSDMAAAIMPALTVTPDPQIRAITAIYLVALSGRYQVQY